jgi:protein lifeguard
LIVISYVFILAVLIALFCFKKLARKVPINYILMFAFVFAESYIVSFICSNSDPYTVLVAAVMTLGLTIGLTVYALTTKTDFTYSGGSLFIFGMVLLIFGIFCAAGGKILQTVYCGLAVILYGFYLIYDIQLLVGNNAYQYTPDDYIIASI